jgi:hypothetical protein
VGNYFLAQGRTRTLKAEDILQRRERQPINKDRPNVLRKLKTST